MVEWLKHRMDPRSIYRMPGARMAFLPKKQERLQHLQIKEIFLAEALPRITGYRLCVDSVEIPLSLCRDKDKLLQYVQYLSEESENAADCRYDFPGGAPLLPKNEKYDTWKACWSQPPFRRSSIRFQSIWECSSRAGMIFAAGLGFRQSSNPPSN